MALQAMLFDMDGTLTRPMLDFPAIKREIGLPPDSYILEALEKMTPAERARAMVVVERHEEQAARLSELNEGVESLMAALAGRGIRVGLITRNSRRSVDLVAGRHGLRFDACVCRDHAAPKPSPAGILLALRLLGLEPVGAVYVGDHTIDVLAGRAAGLRTIWVTNRHELNPRPPADFTVTSPTGIIPLLDELQATNESGARPYRLRIAVDPYKADNGRVRFVEPLLQESP